MERDRMGADFVDSRATSRLVPWPGGGGRDPGHPTAGSQLGSEYEEAFQQARLRLDGRLRGIMEEQAEARRLYLRMMDSRSPFHRQVLLRSLPSDRGLCLVVLLVDEARHRAAETPRDALKHAALATRIACGLSRRHYGECLVEEISARVWACVGGACRRVGRLECAGRAFRRARRHLTKGCGEPLEEGLVLEEEAALHATRGRWIEAAHGLARAAARFRQVRDGHLEARVRIKQGVLEVLRGFRRAAREHLGSGLAELEGEREPYAAALGQVLLAVLLSTGRTLPIQARARRALREARRWLDRSQARTVRRLVARAQELVLHPATSPEAEGTRPPAHGSLQHPLEPLLPGWPRRL